MGKWINKMGYIHTEEYLFPFKKEGSYDTCYNMNKLVDIMLSKINQTQTDKYCMSTLIWSTYVVIS